MTQFDYAGPADVFVRPRRYSSRCPVVHLRFQTGAEAIRHVIEVVQADLLRQAVIETDEVRIEGVDIRTAYESSEFPLARRAISARLKRPPPNSTGSGAF